MDKVFNLDSVSFVAEEILEMIKPSEDEATIIALEGDLGAGKTTITQEMGKILGVKEQIISPTFVIMKKYLVNKFGFENFVHIDAYRIENEDEIKNIYLDKMFKFPKTLIVVEWPEKISGFLAGKNIYRYRVEHEDGENRKIKRI